MNVKIVETVPARKKTKSRILAHFLPSPICLVKNQMMINVMIADVQTFTSASFPKPLVILHTIKMRRAKNIVENKIFFAATML
jgi:hypothetical protein